jgi:sporulation protein YlmC with PRC-barrel domain
MTPVTELIGQSVWDADGVWVGHVVDIRLAKREGNRSVHGLVVSGHRAPLLLGLAREQEGHALWLTRALARVVYAGCVFVPWSSVVDCGEAEVRIGVPKKDLVRT